MAKFRDSLIRLAQWLPGSSGKGSAAPVDDLSASNLHEDAILLSPRSRKALAIRVLRAAGSPMLPLSQAEARSAVDHMQIQEVAPGERLMTEGDKSDTGFVGILLAGEVRIETTVNPGIDPETFAVRGQGAALGAAGFLDGRPRWGTQTAVTPVLCAMLTRDQLKALIDKDALVGAKLLLAIANMLAQVQRAQVARIKVLGQIARSLQEQISDDA